MSSYAPPCFLSDVPSESWLLEKRRFALQDGRNDFGVPRSFGSITGHFDRPLNLPLELLSAIPGERGEQRAVRADSLRYIEANYDSVIREPVYIEVDPFGKAWVSEGNHRVMVAASRGEAALPCNVRYFSGGERLAELSPGVLMGCDWLQANASIDAVPLTEERLRPDVFFHGTPRGFGDFEAAPSGIHLGTFDQAAHAMVIRLGRMPLQEFERLPVDDDGSRGVVMGVKAHLERTARVPDVRTNQAWDDLIVRAKAAGFDSLVYRNQFEMPSEQADSVVVFDPSKLLILQSSIRNRSAASELEALYGRRRGERFDGEAEHRIALGALKEEIGCIGTRYEPHGDLAGHRVAVGRGRLWALRDCAAMSFPASTMVGPSYDDGVPF